MTPPSEDEYAAWRQDPTTRFIMGVCRKTAGEVFNGWVQGTWASGIVDQPALIEKRARADAYLALEQSEYSDWIARSDTPDGDIPLPPSREESYKACRARMDECNVEGSDGPRFVILSSIIIIAFAAGAVIF